MKSLRGRCDDDDSSWREGGSEAHPNNTAATPFRESFLVAVIEDDVAAFAYDQSMMLIDRTLGDCSYSITRTPVGT